MIKKKRWTALVLCCCLAVAIGIGVIQLVPSLAKAECSCEITEHQEDCPLSQCICGREEHTEDCRFMDRAVKQSYVFAYQRYMRKAARCMSRLNQQMVPRILV